MSKKKSYIEQNWFQYSSSWGNYKSDKYKSKGILKEEIRSLLVYGEYSKSELIEIRDLMKDMAFGEFL